MLSPVIIHIPHASVAISEQDLRDFTLTENQMQYELIRLTDWYTDELFGQGWTHDNVVQFQHSRLVVDVERFESDAEEPCAPIGMGATYVKTTQGALLRKLSPARRSELIKNYYQPHHQIFTQKVFQVLEKFNRSVIIDGHSYPTKPLPTQPDCKFAPEIGIGTDAVFTSPELTDLSLKYFKSHGLTVGLDKPFSGTIVPLKILHSKDTRVQSVMIEVRRDLYINEETAKKNSQFDRVQKLIFDYRELVSSYCLIL